VSRSPSRRYREALRISVAKPFASISRSRSDLYREVGRLSIAKPFVSISRSPSCRYREALRVDIAKPLVSISRSRSCRYREIVRISVAKPSVSISRSRPYQCREALRISIAKPSVPVSRSRPISISGSGSTPRSSPCRHRQLDLDMDKYPSHANLPATNRSLRHHTFAAAPWSPFWVISHPESSRSSLPGNQREGAPHRSSLPRRWLISASCSSVSPLHRAAPSGSSKGVLFKSRDSRLPFRFTERHNLDPRPQHPPLPGRADGRSMEGWDAGYDYRSRALL
jgi:hypothetical protein